MMQGNSFEKYWPETDYTSTFNDITVKTINELEYTGFKLREIEICSVNKQVPVSISFLCVDNKLIMPL